MPEMDKAFFDAAKENLNHSKINYMNLAGIIPVTVEERHVATRLPANYMHMNHVGIVYAGSYFVFAEASGATLIKCTYAGAYVPIIKSVNVDPMDIAISNSDGETCANMHIVFYLIKKQEGNG